MDSVIHLLSDRGLWGIIAETGMCRWTGYGCWRLELLLVGGLVAAWLKQGKKFHCSAF